MVSANKNEMSQEAPKSNEALVNEILDLPVESFQLIEHAVDHVEPVSEYGSMVQDELHTTRQTIKAGEHTIEIIETKEKGGGIHEIQVFIDGNEILEEKDEVYSKVIDGIFS